jgi:hypothetical protein
VTVPEAAVHEDNRPVARKDEVGAAGESRAVESEAESPRMKASPKQHLRFRVLCANAGHVVGTLPRGMDVRHDQGITPFFRQRTIAGSRCCSKKTSKEMTLGASLYVVDLIATGTTR